MSEQLKAAADGEGPPSPKARTEQEIMLKILTRGGTVSEEDLADLMIIATNHARDAEARFSVKDAASRIAKSMDHLTPQAVKAGLKGIGDPSRRVISYFVGLPDTYFVERSEADIFVRSGYKRFTAIVPLKKGGSHDYNIGEVYALTNDKSDIMMAASGRNGNHMLDNAGYFRLATDEEIRAYAKSAYINYKLKVKVA